MHCFMLPSAFTVKRMKMTAKVTMGLILMLLSYLLPNKAEMNPGKHRDPELHWTDPSGCSTTDPTRFPSHPRFNCYFQLLLAFSQVCIQFTPENLITLQFFPFLPPPKKEIHYAAL